MTALTNLYATKNSEYENMPKITLPYLSSSLTETGRTGKLKFGWCETDVDIPECAISDFTPAVFKLYNAEHSSVVYERKGQFWYNAVAPVLNRPIGFDGVGSEASYASGELDVQAWVRGVASDVLEGRLDARASEAGTRIGRDTSEKIKIVSRLRAGDGHASDREYFAEWAYLNLVWSGGRLMKRVHSPSACIGWKHSQFALDNQSEPLRGVTHAHTFGSHKIRPGIHFRIDDPAFEAMWAETREAFRVTMQESDMAYCRHYENAARAALGKLADADHISIHDSVVVNRNALERVNDEGWEDMGLRSATSFAKALATRTSPHLRSPGPMRSALEEIKRLVAVLPEDRSEAFIDELENALSEIPADGNKIREWYVDRILERWGDRDVALTPNRFRM